MLNCMWGTTFLHRAKGARVSFHLPTHLQPRHRISSFSQRSTANHSTMASFNTVYSKGKDGSWKTKTDQKKDKLKEIFHDVAKLSGIQSTGDQVRITPHNLIAAMKTQEKSKLLQYFGQKSSTELFKAFTLLDKGGNGAITLDEFLKGAEDAFAVSSTADADVLGKWKNL